MTTSTNEFPEAAAVHTALEVSNYLDYRVIVKQLSALSMKGGAVDILETIQQTKDDKHISPQVRQLRERRLFRGSRSRARKDK